MYIECGDCLTGMQKLPEASVDAVISDPPYGYCFMQRKWDVDVPSVAIWRQCLRVLKPGAFAFIMSAPRLDVQMKMAGRLAEAGFETCYSPIYWCYASGFPKAQNVAKQIDKRLNVQPTLIPYEHPGRKGRSYQTTANVFSGQRGLDKLVVKKEEKPDTRKSPFAGDHNGEWDDAQIPNLKKQLPAGLKMTQATSPEAKRVDGMYGGFQPKPAVEVILVVKKPNAEKTNIDQVLANGKGGTYLDRGRIPAEYDSLQKMVGGRLSHPITMGGEALEGYKIRMLHKRSPVYPTEDQNGFNNPDYPDTFNVDTRGRFPANLLVSDNVLDTGDMKKSTGGDGSKYKGAFWGTLSNIVKEGENGLGIGDESDFSDKFSLDRWWAAYIHQLPKAVREMFPFLYVPKPTLAEKNKGLDEERGNRHITVKPLQLMSYLIALSPTNVGDTILDPFMGSGTTGIACRMADREFIGFELEPQSFQTAQTRLSKIPQHKSLDAFLNTSK